MAFKFLPVVVAVFIINFETAAAENHDDCFNYDATFPNGKKRIDIYNKCGITDSKTMNPKRMKCVVKASQALNEDGTMNKEKSNNIIKKFAYPEYQDELLKKMEKILNPPAENFYSGYPKVVAKICPKDKIFGNP